MQRLSHQMFQSLKSGIMMLKIISKSNEEKIKKLEKEVDTQPKMDEYGRVHIELLDFYKGTIFDSTIRALSKQINESIR